MSMHTDEALVLLFDDPRADSLPRVGGKGANLAALAQAGLPVPTGFCVTTPSFDRFLAGYPRTRELLGALDAVDATDLEAVARVGNRVREELAAAPIPSEVSDAVLSAFQTLGPEHPYAVRSSATLEDLPDASFAGQQDTFLNVRGAEDLLDRLRRCWLSLFTDRAIVYRKSHGYGSSGARLAVVVQRMVFPEISGILFTADPISGHRGICTIDASYGLGEALVSGLVNADLYQVRKATGELLDLHIGEKALAIEAIPEGGTRRVAISAERRTARVLTDAQIKSLAALGRRVEAHRGSAQDIEWAIARGELYLLQSRPITTLFPLPEPAPSDHGLHVYMSFSHLQVNTAPLSTLGSSLFPLLIPFGKRHAEDASPFVAHAGNRVYLDVTYAFRHAAVARIALSVLHNMDEGIARRIEAVVARPEFRSGQGEKASIRSLLGFAAPFALRVASRLFNPRPAQAREHLEAEMERRLNIYAQRFGEVEKGAPRLRVARQELSIFFSEILLSISIPPLLAGILSWKLLGWMMKGRVEPRVVEAISRGLTGNVTTDMDLALGDLADETHAFPELAARLAEARSFEALNELASLPGGAAWLDSWQHFLDRYGCRSAGEIDLAVPRWSDDPAPLLTLLSGMLGADEPGAHRRRHGRAVASAEEATQTIFEVAAEGPLGALRQPLAKALVARVRAYLSLREHHKFLVIKLFAHVRRVVLEAGEMATERGILAATEDVWSLELDELMDALEAPSPPDLRALAAERRAALRRAAELSPPPVLTSDGEAPRAPRTPGAEVAPTGALTGNAVSSGVIEGIARVIHDPATEVLKAGEILVAPFTDPGWTPLFMHAGGLVMEVGGLMTHGSVVAREVGIPAVVGVEGATRKIRTGQSIRVDGDRGYVEILSSQDASSARIGA